MLNEFVSSQYYLSIVSQCLAINVSENIALLQDSIQCIGNSRNENAMNRGRNFVGQPQTGILQGMPIVGQRGGERIDRDFSFGIQLTPSEKGSDHIGGDEVPDVVGLFARVFEESYPSDLAVCIKGRSSTISSCS
jgi:hypothetical protein